MSNLFNPFRRFKRKAVEKIRRKKVNLEEVQELKISKEKILADMEVLKPAFDLRDPKWREHPEQFIEQFFDKTKAYT